MSDCRTFKRTYASATLAFAQHTDYACAVEIYLSPRARLVRWVRQLWSTK